jgi:cyclase
MNKKLIRIIPKLDIKNGLLIKGINLEGLRVVGEPYDFARRYYEMGADEIIYVDNVATLYGTNDLAKFISLTAKNIFIPLSVGGGVRSLDDIENVLARGADKVCINSAGLENKKFIKDAAKKFGTSNITIIIEALKIKNKYVLTKSNGRDIINMDPVVWAKTVEDLGAGEIFLTSVHAEGLKKGFDIEITKKISKKVTIPVISHGGAGDFKDVLNVIKNTNISGVAISSMFHYQSIDQKKAIKTQIGNLDFLKNLNKVRKNNNIIKDLKLYLKKNKVNLRYE